MHQTLLPTTACSKIIPCDQIISLTADDPYSRLSLQNGTRVLVQSGLNKIKDLLPDYFFKVHRSHIVNLRQLTEWDKGRGGHVFLDNGTQLPISYRLKREFVQAVHQFNNLNNSPS